MDPPPRVKPKGLADYLEAMSKPVFQAGISWKVVDAKWPSIKEAFHDFDPGWVADLSPKDIDRLAADPRVIRNRKKIEGIVANAGTMLELNTTHRSFRRYLRSFPDYEALARDLRHQFHFLGDHGVYSFLWTVSEEVPDYDEWAASHRRAGEAKAEGTTAGRRPNPSIGPPGDIA
jgi:3-methyladenine DNA glycosylase Tag